MGEAGKLDEYGCVDQLFRISVCYMMSLVKLVFHADNDRDYPTHFNSITSQEKVVCFSFLVFRFRFSGWEK